MSIVQGSPFSDHKPLAPAPNMGRNELCWCRSGRKWKKCHAVREYQPPLPMPVLRSRFYSEAKVTEKCFHPDAPLNCSGSAIRAHTIQKRTGLSEIAEGGHVLSGRDPDPRSEREDLELIGVNKASTFRGFCSYHDTITFREAELSKGPNQRAAFLLSYRALCFEIYMKQVGVSTLDFTRDNLDAGRPFYEQAEIQQLLYAATYSMRLGFDEHTRLKIRWDQALQDGNLCDFQWYYVKFDGVLPIVTSGVFFPERDFGGNALQPITAPVGALALMGFNVLPINGKTSLLFGWLDKKHQNTKFVRTFESIPDDVLASAIIQFCFDTSDNIFVRPSWWISLPKIPKDYLLWNLRNSTPGGKQPDGLVPRSPTLIQAQVLERTSDLKK